MMRKLLLSLSALAGATAALASHAQAAPVAGPIAFAAAPPPAQVQTVQYYEDWHHREWRRREAYQRWRHHEERRRWHEYRHHGW